VTDAELVTAAKQRLTEMSQRALQVHRTTKTREFILRNHNRWQNALVAYQPSHTVVPDHTRDAFEELQKVTAELVERRGFDPDIYLHWLDLYPSLVVTIYLRETTEVPS